MGRERTYLDYNAGAPLRPAARAAMIGCLNQVGNASSVHCEGRVARRAIEQARTAAAAALGADAQSVTFVSGGTEANVTALSRRWKCGERDVEFNGLLVGATEHPSVLGGGRFPAEAVRTVPVDGDGVVDIDALRALVASADGPVLVSVMAANNETGVVQPLRRIADLVHERGGMLHSDAVQALGKMPLDMAELGIDVLTVSAHKIGGPQGVGAIIRRNGISVPPLLTGGGQENHRRAGTENVSAIAGFGAVLAEFGRIADEIARVRRLRDLLESEFVHISRDMVVFGRDAERLHNTTCFAVPGVRAETAMIAFDLDGIAVSSGSACSSGKVSASHVLKAMGVDDSLAGGAVRVSLGWASTEDDISRFLQALARVCENQRPQGQTQAA